MLRDRIRAGDVGASVLCLGVPFGAFIALDTCARYGPGARVAVAATVGAALAAVCFGATMAFLTRRVFWTRVGHVAPADRVTVAAAVRRGDAIRETRLAPIVVAYVRVLLAALEREARRRWFMPVVGLASAVNAAVALAGRSPVEAAMLWLVTAAVVVSVVRAPGVRARRVANAWRADATARELMADRIADAPPES